VTATEARLPGEEGPAGRAGRGPAPEIVGGALAVIVLAVVGTSVLAGGGRPAVVAPTPTPLVSHPPVVATAAPIVDPAVVALLGALNGELVAGADALQRELGRTALRTADVALLIRQLNSKVAYGSDVVQQLGGALGLDEPGGKLAALYEAIGASATDTLGASLNNVGAYRVGAGALVKLIDGIPPLQQALEDLLASPPPISSSSPPPASASPPPPSATPSPAPPTATPRPATPTPSAVTTSATPPPANEQLTNGDFETGALSPWQLLVGGGAMATPTIDNADPASGKASVRIDISAGSTAYGGITLQQGGLSLEAGGLYTLTLSTRAVTDRDLRIRITSIDGASYLTRLVTVGAAWAPSTFTFTAPVTDPSAVLEIELGRSDVTTWIDIGSIARSGWCSSRISRMSL
jgi:hypothetical protein